MPNQSVETVDRLREVQLEETRRLRDEKYRFYEPTGKGEEYINAVGSGDYFVVFYTAANGAGKTAASINILAHLMFPMGSRWFSGKLFQNWTFPKQGRIISEPKNVDNIINDLKHWLPKDQFTASKGGKHYESLWETRTGWKFDVMTYDQDVKEFEGATLGWAWFDEPPPEAIFKATVARMRKGGIIFVSATPLTNAAWFYDYVYSTDPEVLAKGKRINITADVESACIEHGVRGYLKHNHIENIISQYSEDEKQARVHGKFQHLVGLVYKKWKREIHVIKPFQITLRDFTVYEALDPHPRNPDAVLWVAVDRKGTKYVVDELYIKANTAELAERIKKKADNYRVIRRIADPAAFVEDQHTEKSLASRLDEKGLSYLEASKTRQASDRRIEDALDYQEIHGEMLRAPEMYVFDTCNRFIYEMEHYRWDDWTGKQSDKRNPKERPVDKDDHTIECLGRILIQEPVFVEMPVQRQDENYGVPNYDPY